MDAIPEAQSSYEVNHGADKKPGCCLEKPKETFPWFLGTDSFPDSRLSKHRMHPYYSISNNVYPYYPTFNKVHPYYPSSNKVCRYYSISNNVYPYYPTSNKVHPYYHTSNNVYPFYYANNSILIIASYQHTVIFTIIAHGYTYIYIYVSVCHSIASSKDKQYRWWDMQSLEVNI